MPPDRPSVNKWIRLCLRLTGGAVGLLLCLVFAAWVWLRLSLPKLDGRIQVTGLSAPVKVSRDAQGVPTIFASNRIDLARATGFLHGQDRFFQMDLLRRAAAGELPELLGPGPLEFSRFVRQFRLRITAQKSVAMADESERNVLNAYAAGVNAGLASLGARPPEYLLLRQKPRPWKPEDSILILHSMGLQLSIPAANHKADMAIARRALPPSVFDFYVRADTASAAALDDFTPPSPRIPTPAEIDLRNASTNPQARAAPQRELFPGSNAWAVDGRRTGTGSGMVANDMHLDLGLPNVWYRVQLQWNNNNGETRKLVGVTLPGSPALVAGSNTRLAWGFTASQLDVSDQVLLETDADHPSACRVGAVWRPFEIFREEIPVAGSSNALVEIPWSPWGPVGTNTLGQLVSFRWAMQLPEAANFHFMAFEECSRVEELLDLAPGCGLPWLNVLAADREGNIGWTLGGRFPKRFGLDSRFPASWADGQAGWQGWYEPGEMPRVVNPPAGVLWNANNRALGSEAYLRMAGGDCTDTGARARQIRDRLLALTNAHPADLLAIQLDDRAVFLEPWQKRLLQTLERGSNEPRFAELRPLVAGWQGRAAVNSVGYRLVRAFRHECRELLLAPIDERCRKISPQFRFPPGRRDGAVDDLLTYRPAHLLPPGQASYDDMLTAAVRKVLEEIPSNKPLAEWTWGEVNRVRIQHPFGKGIPFLSRWLDVPERQLPGDERMPRVQASDFGSSERLVVSPGHEEDAIFHMPGGQSGHFLSPFYTAGHRDWEEGRATPLLPGAEQHQLILHP